jgi:hypothetical protein
MKRRHWTRADFEHLFSYCPLSGAVTALGRTCRKERVDGSYRQRKVGGTLVREHVIAWTLHYGASPADGVIDHRDRDVTNNRIENLFLATKRVNGINRDAPSNNTSGIKGVSRKGNKFRAYIDGKSLGVYPTLVEAAAARRSAEMRLHDPLIRN